MADTSTTVSTTDPSNTISIAAAATTCITVSSPSTIRDGLPTLAKSSFSTTSADSGTVSGGLFSFTLAGSGNASTVIPLTGASPLFPPAASSATTPQTSGGSIPQPISTSPFRHGLFSGFLMPGSPVDSANVAASTQQMPLTSTQATTIVSSPIMSVSEPFSGLLRSPSSPSSNSPGLFSITSSAITPNPPNSSAQSIAGGLFSSIPSLNPIATPPFSFPTISATPATTITAIASSPQSGIFAGSTNIFKTFTSGSQSTLAPPTATSEVSNVGSLFSSGLNISGAPAPCTVGSSTSGGLFGQLSTALSVPVLGTTTSLSPALSSGLFGVPNESLGKPVGEGA
ncbi:unnamed protein product [Protopolystoma xenopodis]|uniref:Uncharacterized protein n=1 Tax=Protopolystoma xenopodis TaxID=117903 RepID=A0A3S5A3X6_9PLAT|nr:unnamed protein product [Protopolystoma xenopodis]